MSPVIFQKAHFKQITNLTLRSVHNIVPHVLLPQLPNLAKAAFHRTAFSQTDLDGKIQHEKLESLVVETDKATQLENFLLVLNLPCVESLSISAMDYVNMFTVPCLEANLTSLSVTCNIDELDLIEGLRSLSSLRELYIRDRRKHHNSNRREINGIRDNRTEATYIPQGLSREFFDKLDLNNDPSYLPCLEVLLYEGTLMVSAINFLQPLMDRLHIHSRSSRENSKSAAVLRKVKIQANQGVRMGKDQYSRIS
jgi:hypothetical protein